MKQTRSWRLDRYRMEKHNTLTFVTSVPKPSKQSREDFTVGLFENGHNDARETLNTINAFNAVPKSGCNHKRCKVSFSMLNISDNIKSKHFLYSTVQLYISVYIVTSHLQMQIYIENEGKDSEQLCILYNIWSAGLKEFII